jgi:hypothetical protein
MIYESSPYGLVHLSVDLGIDFLEQETLERIVTYEEVIDQDDADNERAFRGKTRDRLERYMRDVGTVIGNVSFNCRDLINGPSGEISMFLREVKTAGSVKDLARHREDLYNRRSSRKMARRHPEPCFVK